MGNIPPLDGEEYLYKKGKDDQNNGEGKHQDADTAQVVDNIRVIWIELGSGGKAGWGDGLQTWRLDFLGMHELLKVKCYCCFNRASTTTRWLSTKYG
jgi:hypothetical protein